MHQRYSKTEGIDNVVLGKAGDGMKVAANPVRDILPEEIQGVYYAAGEGSTIVLSLWTMGTGLRNIYKLQGMKGSTVMLLKLGIAAGIYGGLDKIQSAVGKPLKVNTEIIVGSGGKTGTVWDNTSGTADNMPGTEIPATFKIDLDDSINYINPETGTKTLWTNANAIEHMGEYVGRFGEESWSIGIRSQELLESYSASLNEAMSDLSSKH